MKCTTIKRSVRDLINSRLHKVCRHFEVKTDDFVIQGSSLNYLRAPDLTKGSKMTHRP